MNRHSKKLFFFILILTHCFIYSQKNISGKIQDENNQPVDGASIAITDLEKRNIIAYDISDEKGNYNISFINHTKSIQISVRSMGHKKVIEIIDNKTQIKNFTLTKAIVELKEVVVQLPPITFKKDTINYSVEVFSKDRDRSIGDVLKRMPGIEVQANGQIHYQGKPINKYYIEGLDLLEGKYRLANENLAHKQVASIQVLENHQPIKILDSLVFSDQAAINIKLKNKNTFTGQAELGVGLSPLLWNTNITPMLFSKNKQLITSYQTNNTGDDIAAQLKKLTRQDITEEFKTNTKEQDWLSIQQLVSPNFSKKRWLDNNTHLLSTNFLYKIKDDYEIRLNIDYLNDYQKQNGYTKSLFFVPNDTISLFENNDNQLFYNSIETNLTLHKNTKKSYLKNSLQFKGSWDHQNGNILTDDTHITQKLSNNYFNLFNQLHSIIPMGKQLITLNSEIGINQTPQNLRVNPGSFEDILNNGNPYQEVIQNVELKSLYTNNYISLTKGVNRFSFSLKTGFQLELQNLESNIRTSEKQMLENKFYNNLDWYRGKLYFHLQNQYVNGKWKIILNTPINIHSYQIKDNSLQKQQALNRFTFEPNIFINYNINAYWKINGNAALSNSFGTINKMHYAYILQNYRNLERIDSPLPELLNKNFSGTIAYRNPIKTIFANATYTFNQRENNLLYENDILPNGATEINAIEKYNIQKSHNFSGRISKYFSNLNSILSVNSDYSTQKFKILLNNELTDILNNNRQFGTSLETDITPWLNTEYNSSFLFSHNKIQNQENRKIQQQSHQLNLNFSLNEMQSIELKTEYIKSILYPNKTENVFSDLLYRYSIKNIDFELHLTNIFNTKNYRTASVNEFYYIETSYQLRPAQLLLKARITL